MRQSVIAITLGLALLAGCKAQVNPHKSPEGDPAMVVALEAASARGSRPELASTQKKVVLSINNYPGADEPLEQDAVQREFEAFEKQNPDIRIEYSTWRYTPESFFERARNRMLTDIVEVEAAQVPSIIDLNYAADITDLVKAEPGFKDLNPEAMGFLVRDGRIYGVPVELNTMALFYNRRVFDGTAPVSVTTATVTTAKKGKGADDDPRGFLFEEIPDEEPVQLAQFWPFRRQYQEPQQQNQPQQPQPRWQQPRQAQRPQNQDPQQGRRTTRGEEQVREYYNLQQPRSVQRSPYGSYYDTPQYRDPRAVSGQPGYEEGDEAADGTGTGQARRSINDDIVGDDTAATPGRKERRSIDEDILLPEDEAALAQSKETRRDASQTTVVLSTGAPATWVEFVRTAVKHTNHSAALFGYAPVMFAEGGGREFSQWGVQSGLQIAAVSGETVKLDVNTSGAADVAQFLKDLHFRYDVTPPIERCYAENVLRMFGEGRVAMCMMPATGDTIRRLLRHGMPLDSIGIAPLPRGPQNRRHLAFGRCLIISAQLDREERAAAVKWLMFRVNPETRRLRQQFYFREQEMTGAPSVPLYVPVVQEAYNQSLRPFRTLPLYADYEGVVAGLIVPEPGFFTDKLYAAISDGIRPIVSLKDSNPSAAIAEVATDFETKYLRDAPTPRGLQQYLDRLAELARQ